ncbi:hypothetical protein G6F16_001420 [Rhizopus arrhizus]|nr:hypothetical protein G6F22_011283 [Rhizopus arrhizus]KAG0780517.1 hypothetical protein G6F21_012098 [Rhizopus arrhizus]KAG0818744.1 hypothetical protein G6F20_001304 [Rhizopus arrhizus]KAG0820868.1 hypothetical protein G6F19_012230 [Rhizopus arrhizus]KAG0844865.1 hypothetical protein G6F18_001482 [Rhizopus arrhizus]
MNHSLTAINIYHFLSTVHQECADQQLFNSFILSLKSPKFAPLWTITQRWSPIFATEMPKLLESFQALLSMATESSKDEILLQTVADHYPLIYKVSCFLESDLELELFVRCLCLDITTPVQPQEIKPLLLRFLNQLPVDVRDCVMHVITEDEHHYLAKEDWVQHGFLDLDRMYHVIGNQDLFEQVMAVIQNNTHHSLPWTQTIQDIYELVYHRKEGDIWDQLAPILQQVQIQEDSAEYESYEDYVQKNFLDDGGQQYLENEINRNQVELMFQNLKM